MSINRDGGLFDAVSQELPAVELADVLVSDLDGDGLLDLYLVSSGENVALLGDGTGRFIEATERLGLADAGCGISAERVALDSFGEQALLLHNATGDVIFWATRNGFRRDADTPAASHPTGDDALATPQFLVAQAARLRGLGLTPEEKRILSLMSIVYLDDGSGQLVNRTLRITGVNLQIVNGLDATNGYPTDPDSTDPAFTVVNGVGNLIVGYNELDNFSGDDRTDSHNMVVGQANSFTSFGGFVGTHRCTISGPFASVTGGCGNVASGIYATVSGGYRNTASGESASVSGGRRNSAVGSAAWVSGGLFNESLSAYASVSGGFRNEAAGHASSVSGGFANTASGTYSSISGGRDNFATGFYASVTGGHNNRAAGCFSSVSGGYQNLATDTYGGYGAAREPCFNDSSTTVSGGRFNTASGLYSSISGGHYNTASGQDSSVSGGSSNEASGDSATLGGGSGRSAQGTDDWVAGSLFEDS